MEWVCIFRCGWGLDGIFGVWDVIWVSREVCLLEFMLCVCVCVCVCVCLRFYLYDENGNALLCFPCAIINMAWYREKERKKGMD